MRRRRLLVIPWCIRRRNAGALSTIGASLSAAIILSDAKDLLALTREHARSICRSLLRLALTGDTLWVADINHVRAFNRRTGAPIADIDLSAQKATFLNDITVGGDGAIYVTDTGTAIDATAPMSHPGVDQIFKISGGKATALRADSLDAPNGITWDRANGRFIIATSNGNSVKTWKEGDKAATTLVSGPGQYDGVEVLADGRILVTSWADKAVHVIQNGTMSTLVPDVAGPADIGVDTKRNVLAIPRLNDNKVEYYKIP
jgi:hypothetical protein